MSLSNTPVMTSRTNRAPVARATAIDAVGSHSRLTPNGRSRSAFSRPITAASAAAASTPTWRVYGRSNSLQNRIPSTPAAWSASTSRAAES